MTKNLVPEPSLAFLARNNPEIIHLLENELKEGDYIFVNTKLDDDSEIESVLKRARQIRNAVKDKKVHVYTLAWYSKINKLESQVPTLSKGIDFVAYDYERAPKFSPEFTADEAGTNTLFKKASDIVHANGFKIMITPPYGTVRGGVITPFDWHWENIIRDNKIDALVIQFQGFFKFSNSDRIKIEIADTIKQISNKSPDTLTFVQLSITPAGGTADQNISSIHDLQKLNINKFLIFYSLTQLDDLKKFFDNRS